MFLSFFWESGRPFALPLLYTRVIISYLSCFVSTYFSQIPRTGWLRKRGTCPLVPKLPPGAIAFSVGACYNLQTHLAFGGAEGREKSK